MTTVLQGDEIWIHCPHCSRAHMFAAPRRGLGYAPIALKNSERTMRSAAHPCPCGNGFSVVCDALDETGKQWSVRVEVAP